MESEATNLKMECEEVIILVRNLVDENEHLVLEQGEYQSRYISLMGRYDTISGKYNQITKIIGERIGRRERIEEFLRTLNENEVPIIEFDNALWCSIIDKLVVYSDRHIVLIHKNSMEQLWINEVL